MIFANVGSIFTRTDGVIEESFRSVNAADGLGVVIVENGTVACAGSPTQCPSASYLGRADVIDLNGGSISPGLVTFGAPLGLEEIQGEASTRDGAVLDPFFTKIPSIIGGDKGVIRAVDGLQYGGRDVLYVYVTFVFCHTHIPTVATCLQSGLSCRCHHWDCCAFTPRLRCWA